ncbi:MAG: hypothetical protein IK027_03800 [Deltaproteobacteria bacterium]|nr:hypothetical protein [Deltaproteobacteria bacterium]
MNILVSTLGLTPEIIEETIGFFNCGAQDFYTGSKVFSSIQAARGEAEIKQVDELWLVATDQQNTTLPNGKAALSTREKFDVIKQSCAPYGVIIRLFLLTDVPDITSREEADAFHDLPLRVVAAAKKRVENGGPGGRLYLSLACGRKTMSAAMQDAAHCFGCDQLVHILGDKKEDALPVLLGAVTANPALRELLHNAPDFPDREITECPSAATFLNDIQKQKQRSQHFFTTYYLDERETRANFHILYTLPPGKIESLKAEHIGVDPARRGTELEWLKRLPKADLHCHLGGVLSPGEMIEAAGCYETAFVETARHNSAFADWRNSLRPLPEKPHGGWKAWREKEGGQPGVPKSLIAPALLLTYRDTPDELERLIYGEYLEENAFCGIDLPAYEALGDLQGSALLCKEAALRKTVQILLRRCKEEHLSYLELRCSPLNYATPEFPAKQVLRCILEELEQEKDMVDSSLLLIATRHGKKKKVRHSIAASLQLVYDMEGDPLFGARFRGFDLAGNEEEISPEELRPAFLEIMEDCRNITIHAGETAPAESVWEAVYHLNAERIGHGLSLHNNDNLMKKFLERGIGIEMCPSSNFQIVGFRDNYLSQTAGLPKYPLKQYLDKELKVSVNTDDPGISRTTITNELHRAARLTPGGLSKWEILQLVCNGFRTAFAPYEKKKQLIHRVEKALGELIQKDEL